MILESADIHFECGQCGQHLLADPAGAGVTANCPICEAIVTVPHVAPLLGRNYPAGASKRDSGIRRLASSRTSFIDPGKPETGGESEVETLERALAVAEEKASRFQQLFQKAVGECERLTASHAHAQSELKQLAAERQQITAELAQSRQFQSAAEQEAAAVRARSAAVEEQLHNDLATARERIAATDTQLAARERELAAARSHADEILQAFAAAQTDLNELRAERANLRTQLDGAGQKLARAAEVQAGLEEKLSELSSAQEQLRTAEAARETLTGNYETLRTEAEALRRDFVSTQAGQELIELRQRLDATGAERDRIASALAQRDSQSQTLAQTEARLRGELAEMRRSRDDAERRAEAGAESKLNHDNAVLRGIIERQNGVMEAAHTEVRRLRRARFSIRILYLLLGLACTGLIAFAIHAFARIDLLKSLDLF